jgi:hypothetical protein
MSDAAAAVLFALSALTVLTLAGARVTSSKMSPLNHREIF